MPPYLINAFIFFHFQGGYPARLKKVLIVTAPLWFKAPFKILRLFVREKLRERVFTVSVPTLSLHVPRKALPIHLGGELDIEHNTWLLHCRKSMTNREDELLANIGGLSAATHPNQNNTTVGLTGNSTVSNQHITNTTTAAGGVLTNGDCQRFLAEPNENITTSTQQSLTNGHHTDTTTTVPIANNLNNLNSTSPTSLLNNKLVVNLTNGIGDTNNINGDIVAGQTATTPIINGVTGTIVSAVSGGGTNGTGGGGVGVGVVGGQTTTTNTTTGLSDFWTENPPSSASSGFSDDDSLAGQEGDPKTIEQIVQMVKSLGRQGLVKEYADIRSRAPDGTFSHAR